MILQFLIGIVMIATTVAVCAVFIVIAAEVLRRNARWINHGRPLVKHVAAITLVSVWLVVGMGIVMMLWAVLFSILGLFEPFEAAVYFSMIAFTTLGFGDVLLDDPWRLLSGFIAIDGFILFGLNTAFLFEVLRRLRNDAIG